MVAWSPGFLIIEKRKYSSLRCLISPLPFFHTPPANLFNYPHFYGNAGAFFFPFPQWLCEDATSCLGVWHSFEHFKVWLGLMAQSSFLLSELHVLQVTAKFKCVARVVAVLPWQAEDFCSPLGTYRIRLTLEDPTARIHAFLFGEDGVRT